MINKTELAKLMNRQTQVWADNTEAEEALLDTCHALAAALHLQGDEKACFMEACGWTLVWSSANEPRFADPRPDDGPARLAQMLPSIGRRKIV